MVFVLDNYDSFSYNLVQYMGELGAEMVVRRNDELSAAEVEALRPSHIVISPGPCTPQDAGISIELIQHFARLAREGGRRVPLLGVCLGHQCIGHVFGANVVRAGRLMHGKTSPILHDNEGVFAGLPSPFEATRYHSLIIDPPTVPDSLVVNARTAEKEIMGVRHREFPIHGVQFHPESILTRHGKELLKNFLTISTDIHAKKKAA